MKASRRIARVTKSGAGTCFSWQRARFTLLGVQIYSEPDIPLRTTRLIKQLQTSRVYFSIHVYFEETMSLVIADVT